MDLRDQLDLMVDRIIDLPKGARPIIEEAGYSWFQEGDNDDYIAEDAIMVHRDEIKAFEIASKEIYNLYIIALKHVRDQGLWSRLGLKPNIIKLIEHDLDRFIPHICGRFDFAGGIEDMPIKLIEFNADTCTIMPESTYIQSYLHHQIIEQSKGQFNYMINELTIVFRRLKNKFPDKVATLLLTSLGHIEDKLNLNVIREAAEEAGFEVDYANLEDVIFDEDGVFLQNEENYIQYNFVYKLVPWEFIMLEEPELMDILTDLSINHGLVILNPAYSIALQAKQMLPILYELFPDNPYILPCFDNKDALTGKKYVRKTNFGRMGENVKIVEANGETLAKTKGEFGSFSKVFQSYAEMYADEDGDIYQAQMYMGEGTPCCLSFRRRDDEIIDDDSEFVTHVIFE